MADVPTLEHANMVYRALMEVWDEDKITEAEFINAVAMNLGKFIGWMKRNPDEYTAIIRASAEAWREDSPMPEPEVRP